MYVVKLSPTLKVRLDVIERNPLLQLVMSLLMKYLSTLAARLIVGRIERWLKMYILGFSIIMGGIIGYGGMVVCLAFSMSTLIIIGYAFIGTVFTFSGIFCWRELKRESATMEAELASWLQSRGHAAIKAL